MTTNSQDLKAALNACKANTYTRIAELREGAKYPIVDFEKVVTPYGEAVMATLEGLAGDDPMRVYLPRRFNAVLGERDVAQYNAGVGPRLQLLKKPGGNNNLEFV